MKDDRILHITHDEKFINGAYYLFEQAFPGKNTFVVIKPPADPPIRYLSNCLVANSNFEINSKDSVGRLVEMSKHYAVTVLHGINSFNAGVFSGSSRKDCFMGIVHGAEIYNSGLLQIKLMGEKTVRLYEKINRNTIYDRLKEIYRSIRYHQHENLEKVDLRSVLYRIKAFGTLPGMNYGEYIDKELYNPTVQRVPFTYYPIEHIIKDESLRATGSDILLGNSASATNNHLEAFDLLKGLSLGNRKIVSPLSYGSPRYAKAISDEGNKQFGDRFIPITSFLPIGEYNQLISDCGIVIMNHYRPQAVGNIIAALYMGCKVFLNETNIYQYFKNLGCHVYLIERNLKAKDAFQLLSDGEVAHNRTVLKNNLGISNLVDGMRQAVEKIFNPTVTNRKREAIV